MRVVFLLVVGLLSAISCNAYAQTQNYLEIEIPVLDGAKDIETDVDERFYIRSLKYKIKTGDLAGIRKFYASFFEEMGWKRFDVVSFNGWAFVSSRISLEGQPTFTGTVRWESVDIPVAANVLVTLTGYVDGIYNAEVDVVFSPKVHIVSAGLSGGADFSRLITDEPRNIFILADAFGADALNGPLDVHIDDVPEKLRGEIIVQKYLAELKQQREVYDEFGAQYIHRTKPIDGRFTENNLFNDVPQGADETDGEASEDPLARWRLLQEERIQKEMQKEEKELQTDCP